MRLTLSTIFAQMHDEPTLKGETLKGIYHLSNLFGYPSK